MRSKRKRLISQALHNDDTDFERTLHTDTVDFHRDHMNAFRTASYHNYLNSVFNWNLQAGPVLKTTYRHVRNNRTNQVEVLSTEGKRLRFRAGFHRLSHSDRRVPGLSILGPAHRR